MNPDRTLETDRLLLRPHRLEDFEECLATWSDPEVARFVGGRPFSREEVWTKVLRYRGHWELNGFGFWVLREKKTDRFVGEAGFMDFKRDMVPSFGSAPEAGWVLAQWAWGKGFATEAMRAALAWLEAHRGKERTVCMIQPANQASIGVARKCGYQEWTRTAYKNTDLILFERV